MRRIDERRQRIAERLRGLGRPADRLVQDDEGAATAEYAITIMAAVAFAGVLVVIMKSGEVQQILTDLVHSALSYAG